MARTVVPITPLPSNSITEAVVETIVQADGAIVPAKGDLQGLILVVTQTNGTQRVLTIKKGAGDQALTAGQGDLTFTVPATTGHVLVNLEGTRVTQVDGSVHVDFAASFAGVIAAYRIPRGG
jgi:hypothetical protein